MNKELKYNGYSANPSDHECADGDLATALGLIQEDGALKPILPPAVTMTLNTGEVVKYIHRVSNTDHYITVNTSNDVHWRSNNVCTLLHNFLNKEIFQIVGIGNTLIVLANDGMHYFLWKDNEYLYLGTEIPECPISFGLIGELVPGELFTIDHMPEHTAYSEIFIEPDRYNITDAKGDRREDPLYIDFCDTVMAKVNKFIARESLEKGKFLFPFFVRYGYRLFDGSIIKHSAPILMLASTNIAPYVFWDNYYKEVVGRDDPETFRIYGMMSKLDYAVADKTKLSKLQDWADIVKSVDVFISAPLYSYDQSGKYVTLDSEPDSLFECYHVCKAYANYRGEDRYFPERQAVSDNYLKIKASELSYFLNNNDGYFPESPEHRDDIGDQGDHVGMVVLPQKEESVIVENIKDCSQFYLLKSIKLKNLAYERTIISIDKDYLGSLVTKEVMTDDYNSHDGIIPSFAFLYNGRLNITGIKRSIFNGFHTSSLLNYTNGNSTFLGDENSPESVEIYYYIKEDGRDIIVRGDSSNVGYNSPIVYLYYPNPNAYKAIICKTHIKILGENEYEIRSYYEVALSVHNFLNGVYYFGGWDDLKDETLDLIPPTLSLGNDKEIDVINKIYTSDVNNPFYFPVLGINTVGTGKIIGISSAAKALSEGQFGQFPLYVFSTEGVWALEVSATGSYSTKQPITRDACINADSITQIDSAVLFVTDRGIMLISGSTASCISESLKTEGIFTIADLPKSDKLVEIYNSKADDDSQLTLDDLTLLPFKEFISECRMIYDYYNQRIVVYNPNARYAYVYSLKSKMWGMCSSNIVSGVNSYPEALAMTSDFKLVDFSQSTASGVTALVVTRPFSMDNPNTLKTINTIIQRGLFVSNHVSQVLYGSSDLYNWQVIWSSADRYMRGFRGTPYKAFRLAIVCDFGKSESLSGCSIQYSPRMLNNLR